MKHMLVLLLPLLLLACEKDDPQPVSDCGPAITISDLTDVPDSDPYVITAANVEGLCLALTVQSTGCGSEGWTATLRTDGTIAESSPTQTAARLILDRNDGDVICQAEISRDFTFDLTAYVADALPTVLSLEETALAVTID